MKHQIFRKFNLYFPIAITAMTLFFVLSAQAQSVETPNLVSSGGSFALEKTVIAGGGSSSQTAQPQINKSGTSGQPIAGYRSTGGNFALYSGFWSPETLAPTASGVTVGGRVKNATGKGIRNVIVTITFPSGEQRTALSGASGYYRFIEIPAGETYIFSVAAKRFTFSQPTQIRSIMEETQDIDFIANAAQILTSEITPQ